MGQQVCSAVLVVWRQGVLKKNLKIMGEALAQIVACSHKFEALLSASSLHVAAPRSEMECRS